MKKLLLLITTVLLLAGCSTEKELTKHSGTFFGTFDTVVSLIGFTGSEEEFNDYLKFTEQEFNRLHKEFDYYTEYDGINNLYTVNQQAGVAPVEVSDDIFNLLKLTKERTETISNKTDISYGALFELWHHYREEGIIANHNESHEHEEHDHGDDYNYDAVAALPTPEEIKEAQSHYGMDHLILDEENKTVFIDDPNIRIDVGAVAKGYATEVVANALVEKGLTSGILNSGGNIRTIGAPQDGRENWGIGIQNPDYILGKSSEENAEVLYVHDTSVVTSGDYQRFYTVDGKNYHHLIDPQTGYPGDLYRSVSIMIHDAGLADFLSTALFMLPMEEGRALAEQQGAEVMWILQDGTIEYTEGMRAIAHSQGATE